MLRVQPGVPIHLGKVEVEDAVVVADGDVHIVRAGEDLVRERTEDVVGADVFDLVDHGADFGVLVQEDLPDQMAVGKVLFADVHVGDVADLCEAGGDLGVGVFREDGVQDVMEGPV